MTVVMPDGAALHSFITVTILGRVNGVETTFRWTRRIIDSPLDHASLIQFSCAGVAASQVPRSPTG